MKNVLTIMKKEILRVIKDKRLLIMLIMPGILIYGIYSLMGSAFSGADESARSAEYKIMTINLPDEIKQILEADALDINASYTYLTATTKTEIDETLNQKKDLLISKDVDILLVFDTDFTAEINKNDGSKPAVAIYYNPSESTSVYAYQKIAAAMQIYKSAVLDARVIDAEVFNESVKEIYDEKAATSSMFALLIPLLIIAFLFSGCMALVPDAIAGEKERGTIATILITPIKRSELALGKVLALSILAIISALSSFAGVLLSLPKLLGGVSLAGLYGFSEYFLLLLVLISTVLLIIGLMSILSAFAKTVKEASLLITPFMFISIFAGLSSVISGGAATSTALYFIPIYNSVQAMVSILTYEVSIINLLMTFISNIVYLGACVLTITKLFNSEKIMFSK